MSYVTKTKECREKKKVCPFLLENSRPQSPLQEPQTPLSSRTPDFLSTCLGSDSLSSVVVSDSLRPYRLQVSLSGRVFSREAYWSVLANTGCHTLLEHYISCCPSRQLPWVPGAARTPVTQAAAPPPHLAFTGADPSPPGQPQEQIPVDDPHAEVEIKPHLKPRGSVAKEDPKPSHQLYRLQIKSTRSTRLTLCLWTI